MQVSIENTSGLERRITIAVPATELDTKVNQKVSEVAKNVRVNGFRKGKVPLTVVKKQYGEAIRQEVAGDLINSSFPEALKQESINPAGQPAIEVKSLESGKDFEYTAVVEVYPEISLSNLEGFDVNKLSADITDQDVENTITKLREQKADFSEADRAAADGDRVTIDFVGKKDGEAFEGGTGSNHPLVLGSKSMIPGFEEGVVGMKAGDEKVIPLNFPEDYHVDDLKGAAVEFTITAHKVEEKSLPEIDDEFIKSFGGESLDDLKEKVKENMGRELKRKLQDKLKSGVMDQLLKAHEFEVPKALIASEIKVLREQMMQQFGGASNQNLDLESLLPDTMFSEQAERRVSLGLILGEVVKEHELKADPDQVRQYIDEMAASYESPEELVNYYYQNQQMLASVESAVLEDSVVDFIVDKANVTEETVDYETAVGEGE